MAIPISLPNADDVEDSYRSLDLLLEQLFITLRQVLIYRRRQAQAAAQMSEQIIRHRHTIPPEVVATTTVSETNDVTSSRLPLPDLVVDATTNCAESQPKETERVQRSEASRTWDQVGAELRRIADQVNSLEQENEKNGKEKKDDKESKDSRMREASLLSLLCPPLGGSVWTTVALLVGWGLLSRTR